jgi:hypothetical protein
MGNSAYTHDNYRCPSNYITYTYTSIEYDPAVIPLVRRNRNLESANGEKRQCPPGLIGRPKFDQIRSHGDLWSSNGDCYYGDRLVYDSQDLKSKVQGEFLTQGERKRDRNLQLEVLIGGATIQAATNTESSIIRIYLYRNNRSFQDESGLTKGILLSSLKNS